MDQRMERVRQIEHMYKEHYRYLLNFLSAQTPDKQLIEDIIQDVFATLINKSDLLVDLRYSKQYLKRSARNKLIDCWRKAKPALYEDEETIGQLQAGRAFEREVELTEEIRQVLGKLPDHYRNVIIARDYYGYSYQEIAELTGCSSNSVKIKIFRARKQFIHHYRQAAGSMA
jgi:RNA polymerase sigma-70 factor (ECF subfamily)